MTAAHARTTCCCDCAATAELVAHHHRLLLVDVNVDELLALMEMALTWHELDYSSCDVLGPQHWLTFAQRHSWTHPERAESAFSLAVDIVGRSSVGPAEPVLATVIELVRG